MGSSYSSTLQHDKVNSTSILRGIRKFSSSPPTTLQNSVGKNFNFFSNPLQQSISLENLLNPNKEKDTTYERLKMKSKSHENLCVTKLKKHCLTSKNFTHKCNSKLSLISSINQSCYCSAKRTINPLYNTLSNKHLHHYNTTCGTYYKNNTEHNKTKSNFLTYSKNNFFKKTSMLPISSKELITKKLAMGFVNHPPVFPTSCSLFDSRFNGGVYTNELEDEHLLQAVKHARDRWRKKTSVNTQKKSLEEEVSTEGVFTFFNEEKTDFLFSNNINLPKDFTLKNFKQQKRYNAPTKSPIENFNISKTKQCNNSKNTLLRDIIYQDNEKVSINNENDEIKNRNFQLSGERECSNDDDGSDSGRSSLTGHSMNSRQLRNSINFFNRKNNSFQVEDENLTLPILAKSLTVSSSGGDLSFSTIYSNTGSLNIASIDLEEGDRSYKTSSAYTKRTTTKRELSLAGHQALNSWRGFRPLPKASLSQNTILNKEAAFSTHHRLNKKLIKKLSTNSINSENSSTSIRTTTTINKSKLNKKLSTKSMCENSINTISNKLKSNNNKNWKKKLWRTLSAGTSITNNPIRDCQHLHEDSHRLLEKYFISN